VTGGTLGFLLIAVLVPLLVTEAGDLLPSLARCLLRWGARRIGPADQAERYEEEWLADLERVPGKLTKLVHACGVLVRSVPRLRAQYRERRARPPGVLRGRAMGRLAKELAGTREIGITLQHVAELFVQDFADHFFIDLFHGDVLIRRVERHKGDWTPPPGTWARVGEQIRYPEGHFCQQAMARRDTVIVPNLVMEDIPAPSAQSAAVSYGVGLTSIIAAPLYVGGVLLGVMSVARSGLTDRTEPHYAAADRDIFGAVAGRVAIAIENAKQLAADCQATLGPRIWRLRSHQRAFLAPD
jgi:hypothetical protein